MLGQVLSLAWSTEVEKYPRDPAGRVIIPRVTPNPHLSITGSRIALRTLTPTGSGSGLRLICDGFRYCSTTIPTIFLTLSLLSNKQKYSMGNEPFRWAIDSNSVGKWCLVNSVKITGTGLV